MKEMNIRDFFIYLKRYFFVFIILAIVLVAGVVAYDSFLKKPIYQAQTTVVIARSDGTDGAAVTLNDINASQKLTTTYSEIAKSELVLNQVIKNLGLNIDAKTLGKNLIVRPVEDTSILSVTVYDSNARLSARIANEVAKVFSKQVAEIYNIENVKQLAIAEVPELPSNNNLVLDIVIVVVLSVILTIGFALARFYLDGTLKHSDDLEKDLGVAVLGSVLKGPSRLRNTQNELVSEKSPRSIISENIKSLRTNLQFALVDQDSKTVLVTSVNPGEGKNFIAANLAASFAQADKKVLIVDCDLRGGRLHEMFGVPNSAGLSNLLASDFKSLNGYVRATKIKNLNIITCGTYPPNPSELLASQKDKRLAKILRDNYDIVIFDGAPISGITDSVILSKLADETLIVVRDVRTKKSDLLAAKESLNKVKAKIVGVVFNMVD